MASERPRRRRGAGRSQSEYWELSRRLSVPAFDGRPLHDFVAALGGELLDFTAADEVEFWLRFRGELTRYACRPGSPPVVVPAPRPAAPPGPGYDALCVAVLDRSLPAGPPALTPRGSLLVEDSRRPPWSDDPEAAPLAGVAESVLMLPFGAPGAEIGSGLVVLKLRRRALRDLDVALLEEVAQDLALAFTDLHGHVSLRERMKELNCLYRMALVVEQPHTSVDEVLQGIVEILPEAWLHEADAWVRLEVEGALYTAGPLRPEGPSLRAEVVAAGRRRGVLEVGYAEEKPTLDEGPFLREERALLGTVAREIALILERQEVAAASRQLQEQLQHADRLATIGALAAGIGHELNDPLNNVLGYAGLIAKRADLPEQVRRDVATISTSAQHARDVIRQLLLFARRMPQRRERLRLSAVVDDAYPFLVALCSSSGVRIARDLAPELPPVWSDADQLRQVLVNLVVNAAQAMPRGGQLSIATGMADAPGLLRLVVEDTGPGMSEEVRRNAFLPFYTTRAEGTGLGLAVVHGIVSAHGGEIRLDSEPGRGSRFEILLPVATE